MTSELTESTAETSTDRITLTYTASSGVFDDYVFTLVELSGTKTTVRNYEISLDFCKNVLKYINALIHIGILFQI